MLAGRTLPGVQILSYWLSMVFHFHHLGNFILVYVFNSTCTPYLVCYRLTHPVIPVNTFTHVLSFLFSWGHSNTCIPMFSLFVPGGFHVLVGLSCPGVAFFLGAPPLPSLLLLSPLCFPPWWTLLLPFGRLAPG